MGSPLLAINLIPSSEEENLGASPVLERYTELKVFTPTFQPMRPNDGSDSLFDALSKLPADATCLTNVASDYLGSSSHLGVARESQGLSNAESDASSTTYYSAMERLSDTQHGSTSPHPRRHRSNSGKLRENSLLRMRDRRRMWREPEDVPTYLDSDSDEELFGATGTKRLKSELFSIASEDEDEDDEPIKNTLLKKDFISRTLEPELVLKEPPPAGNHKLDDPLRKNSMADSTLDHNPVVLSGVPVAHQVDVNNSETSGLHMVQSSQMTSSDMFQCLIEHGCQDLTSLIDPGKYSECMVAEGGFGDIWRGQLYDGISVAVKVLRFALVKDGGSKSLKRMMREIYAWSKLDHRNVHKLLGVTVFQARLGMVSKWMENGNLRDYLGQNKDLDRLELCIQVATGVEYIHGIDIIHGDLKAANILVSSDGVLKLTDFDYALISDCSLIFTDTTRVGGGTLRWMAPELFLETSHQRNKETDIYALGMTFLEIFTGVPPYYPQCTNDAQVMFKVMQRVPPERSPEAFAEDDRGDEIWSILQRCWNFQPTARPRARAVLTALCDCTLQSPTLPHAPIHQFKPTDEPSK